MSVSFLRFSAIYILRCAFGTRPLYYLMMRYRDFRPRVLVVTVIILARARARVRASSSRHGIFPRRFSADFLPRMLRNVAFVIALPSSRPRFIRGSLFSTTTTDSFGADEKIMFRAGDCCYAASDGVSAREQ